MKQNLKVRSANTARVLMDGKEVGLMSDVRISDSYNLDGASGIGDIHVQEYVPTMARHQVSCSKVALRTSSLYKLGIIPENGEEALRGAVLDIEVFDRATGEILRKAMNCSYDSGDVSVTKHAIIATSAMFYATDVSGKM